jgi:hypothetical protein
MTLRVRVIVVLASTASFFLTPGGCSKGERSSGAGDTVTSETLRAEFDKVLAEMTAGASPDPKKAGAAGSLIVSEAMMRTPGLFQVSSGDEARFKRNAFDDAANRARVSLAEKAFKDKGRPPQLTQYLLDQNRKTPLTGVRLELLAHLAERNAKAVAGQ